MLALKIVGFVLLGIVALLVILLLVPVRARVRYASEQELKATLWVLFIPIRLAPTKEKPEQEETEDKPKPKKKTEPKEKKQSKKDLLDLKAHAKELKENGLSAAVAWLKEVAARILKAADRLLKAVTVTNLTAFAEIAGEDAAQTAVTYGKLCGAVYTALGVVESKLKVKQQDIRIEPAFCLEQTRFGFDVRLKISVWRVAFTALSLLVSYTKMPTVGELKQQQKTQRCNNDKEAI